MICSLGLCSFSERGEKKVSVSVVMIPGLRRVNLCLDSVMS